MHLCSFETPVIGACGDGGVFAHQIQPAITETTWSHRCHYLHLSSFQHIYFLSCDFERSCHSQSLKKLLCKFLKLALWWNLWHFLFLFLYCSAFNSLFSVHIFGISMCIYLHFCFLLVQWYTSVYIRYMFHILGLTPNRTYTKEIFPIRIKTKKQAITIAKVSHVIAVIKWRYWDKKSEAQFSRSQHRTWYITKQSHVFIFNISLHHIMVEKYDIAPLPIIQWYKSGVLMKEISKLNLQEVSHSHPYKVQDDLCRHFHDKWCVLCAIKYSEYKSSGIKINEN